MAAADDVTVEALAVALLGDCAEIGTPDALYRERHVLARELAEVRDRARSISNDLRDVARRIGDDLLSVAKGEGRAR